MRRIKLKFPTVERVDQAFGNQREAETIVEVFVFNKKRHMSILLTSGCSHGNSTEAITIYEAE